MTVSSVSNSVLEALGSQYSTTEETQESGDSLYMDDFLTIFLAQLQYQDPLDPMEGTEMTSQLSQITTVEQLYNANEKLDTLAQQLQSLCSTELLQCIGKDILVEGDEITVQDGEMLGGISFSLEEAAEVEIAIYDSEGNEVRQIQYGSAEAGSHQVEWDGTDDQGIAVSEGSYTYEVVASDDSGEDVSVQTQSRLRVTGITYESGIPYFLAGELRFLPSSIVTIYDPSTQTTEEESG